MAVNPVPTMGWTRGDVAATILLVTQEQRAYIAMRIRAGMEAKGLTNAKLAQNAGLAEKTISRAINAKLAPRYDTLERIAKALDTTEAELRGPQVAPLALDPEAENGEVVPVSQLDRIEDQLKANAEAIEALARQLEEIQADAVVRAAEAKKQIAAAVKAIRQPPRQQRRSASA